LGSSNAAAGQSDWATVHLVLNPVDFHYPPALGWCDSISRQKAKEFLHYRHTQTHSFFFASYPLVSHYLDDHCPPSRHIQHVKFCFSKRFRDCTTFKRVYVCVGNCPIVNGLRLLKDRYEHPGVAVLKKSEEMSKETHLLLLFTVSTTAPHS
jgi:hypothetical protein